MTRLAEHRPSDLVTERTVTTAARNVLNMIAYMGRMPLVNEELYHAGIHIRAPLTRVVASTLAPAVRSSCTMASWPRCAEKCSAVQPSCVCRNEAPGCWLPRGSEKTLIRRIHNFPGVHCNRAEVAVQPLTVMQARDTTIIGIQRLCQIWRYGYTAAPGKQDGQVSIQQSNSTKSGSGRLPFMSLSKNREEFPTPRQCVLRICMLPLCQPVTEGWDDQETAPWPGL